MIIKNLTPDASIEHIVGTFEEIQQLANDLGFTEEIVRHYFTYGDSTGQLARIFQRYPGSEKTLQQCMLAKYNASGDWCLQADKDNPAIKSFIEMHPELRENYGNHQDSV